ncbi:MAG: ABC transporter permease [Opitutales bacterium]|nr:ABC transporter permease [Opitutales bacterium]
MNVSPDRPSRFASNEALNRALSTRLRPGQASAWTASLAFAWRGVLKIKHIPEQLIDVTMTPILFTLMFTYLFGGALAGSPTEYLQFLLPGILVMTVLFSTVYSGVTINTDVTKGVSDRFRSLPVWSSAPLVGSVLADSVRYLMAALVGLSFGMLLGFRPEGGVIGVVAGLSLLLVFAFSLSWVFTTMGLWMKTPNAVMNLGFMAMFPLTFMSNVFVEPETMPGWLEWWVNVNPVSSLATAMRAFMHGTFNLGQVITVLLASAAFTGVFAPLTLYLYRNKV